MLRRAFLGGARERRSAGEYVRVISRSLVVGVFGIAVAIMPLGGLLSGGVFETWVGGDGYRHRVRVIVQDETGLVRAVVGQSDAPLAADSRFALSVPIMGGCGTRVVHLAFRGSGGEYVIQQRNHEWGCSFLDLRGYGTVSILLWAPVDDASVRLDSQYGADLL